MSSYILDKSYVIREESGVSAYRVVVATANGGEAKLPEWPNAGSILGVTVHSQTRQGGQVAVRKAGIVRVMAAGPVAVGDWVNVAGASGKVNAVDEPLSNSEPASYRVETVGQAETAAGADGDIIEVFVCFGQRIA